MCDLVGLVGLAWSTVSRHLAVLKAAGVPEDEKRELASGDVVVTEPKTG